MLIAKTARPKIRNNTPYFGSTLSVYRDSLQYVNSVVVAEWVNMTPIIPQDKARINVVEKLVDSTGRRKAVYAEFDKKFVQFLSCLRRKVIAEAIGHQSSHESRLEKWQANPKGKEPALKSIEAASGVFRDSSWDRASLSNAIQKLEETVDSFGKNFLTRQDLLSAE